MRAFLLLLLLPLPALAQVATVSPYLQLATSDGVTVRWETDGPAGTEVEWGLTSALGTTVPGSSWASDGGTTLHRVELTGLVPGTLVHYVARSDGWSSDPTSFVVPEASPERVRLVAMSDMQRSNADPNVFRDLVADGVLPFVDATFGQSLPEAIQGVLVPGDLVDDGWDYGSWADEYFTPAAPLLSRVPSYPVPGNHESDTDYFFDYFDLPTNGTAGYEEHWWTHDVGRVRVVGLDSNGPYLVDAQLDWLDEVLSVACSDADVDFLVAQLHHPFKSELWLPGENLWTGAVVGRLEEWTTSCGKPSVHLFGHTHGYSRGQSRDHAHLWVNVATAGGAIDYWGEHPQQDYAEFSVSQDDWGFVVLEAESGDDPSLRVRRVSIGNRDGARDNEVRDDIEVRIGGAAPARPEALSPAGDDRPPPQEVVLVGSTFDDPEGVGHGASHWQLVEGACDFDAPDQEAWVQSRNEYGGVDLQAGDDLTDHPLGADLVGETEYCWRVRYRDEALRWSEWSTPSAFTTAANAYTGNLLDNPGAEDGIADWVVEAGVLESLEGGECDVGQPRSGERMFVVGGACESSAFAAAWQDVSLALWAGAVDEGGTRARVRGWLSDWNGQDEPALQVVYLDADGAELGRGARLASATPAWTFVEDEQPVPVGTRALRLRLEGTRNEGEDNDSYVDDLDLRLRFGGEAGDDDDATDGDDDDAVSEGCGCSTSAPASGPLGLLLLMWALRARHLTRRRCVESHG